jgi:hypothetical protein
MGKKVLSHKTKMHPLKTWMDGTILKHCLISQSDQQIQIDG